MAVVNTLPKEQVTDEVKAIYDTLSERFGHVPNIFAVMAHRPAALKNFLPFYAAVMTEGTIEPKYKELAYLKAAQLNGCEY